MSSVAARHGKFARVKPDSQSLAKQIGYAYHFDAGLYAKFLRGRAEKQGTKRIEGKIESAQRDQETGDIVSVTLEDETVVTGDLFIDCSGFRGLLIEESLEAGYEDWSHWLPVDRAIALPCANPPELNPYTRSTAHSAGWQWRIPLQHRTGNGHVFCSSYMEADEAERILRDNLEGEPLGEARQLRFKTGMRRKQWSHNVIALGLSSGFVEPLESTSIHLIQNGIARLFALFPDKQISPVERDEYNRGMRELYEDIRDFIILHYKATQRDDSEFELFTTPSWVAVMLGQNIWPDRHDPIADTLDEEKVATAMAQMREAYDDTALQMPSQVDFLKQSGSWSG